MDGNKTFSNGMRVGVQVELEKGWHTYWENPGDVGAPAVLDISSAQNIEQTDLIYPIPHRISAEPFDFYGYEDEVLFYKTISLPSHSTAKNVDLKIRLDWLVCQELCIPASKTFDVQLPIREGALKKDVHFNSFHFPVASSDIYPELEFQKDKTTLTLSSKNISLGGSVDFFPSSNMNQIFNKPTSKSFGEDRTTFTYPSTKSRKNNVEGVVKIDDKTAYWIGRTVQGSMSNVETDVSRSGSEILLILLFAVIGGMILNFMPCVLPVVSLKILSVTRSNPQNKSKIRRSNLVYALGIGASLFALSLLFLFFQNTGEQLGWGFQLQSPAFITFLIILFFLIGLNLIGFFEIDNVSIPGVGRLFQSDSFTSEFFGGFLITLIATPCTAPFMAAAVGVALTQSAPVIVGTFLCLALGLASPYLLLAFFPRAASLFPKPGKWMVTFKEFLSFPIFLTVAWLVWILNRLTDTKATLFILSALVLIVFFFWTKKKLIMKRSAGKIFLLFGIVFLIALLSVFPLQIQKSGDIVWETFNASEISTYGKDRTTFVDFTADWCITCKANERFAFSNKKVIEMIQNKNIQMIKADWTRRDPSITAVLRSYDRAGVPLYLLYKSGDSQPEILPTLLTPGLLIEAFEK